ncbi:zinc-dependent metalloprotease [Glutamicibacter sp. MNS18]|uniref:zinc-dependent metalloprotease n=1 Tax=Glutamicibacter sp. MNS18 TaxID=2989817 RepID=UPI00223585B1|nr:zinc-dependent metalloprotease [Glutamicibacter sp. MNS18]MCW4466723.1 zinc-dependent metalloprotease [Glutamicibacter sp. MNS18]
MSQWIDWDVALTTAKALTPAGPGLSPGEAARIVADLREAADLGLAKAERISGLRASGPAEVLVVDRAGWAKAVSQNFAAMMPDLPHSPPTVPVIAGAELGAVLSFLATRVLGQFDPYSGSRLLLNAPTITQIRGEMNLNAKDFYLWIATHEQTHRLQFEVAHWIPGVMRESLASIFSEANGKTRTMAEIGERMKALRSEVGELTAIMSVLEGHAMAVMNDVHDIATIKTIRQRFAARGQNRGALATWIGKLLGMDAKARQYERGEKFVRHIVGQIGYEGFNRIFEARENFPTAGELDNPAQWVARMA